MPDRGAKARSAAGNLEDHVEGLGSGNLGQGRFAGGDVDDLVGAKSRRDRERRRGNVRNRNSVMPASRAAIIVRSPIGPAPTTRPRRPSTMPALPTACRQTARGSARAAAVSGVVPDTFTHCAGSASKRLAKPPCICGVFEAEPIK